MVTPIALFDSIDLKDGNGIPDLLKGRIQGQTVAEGLPVFPLQTGFGGTQSRDSMLNVYLHRQEVSTEFMLGGTVQRRQDCGCGKWRLKYDNNCESVRWALQDGRSEMTLCCPLMKSKMEA